MRATHAVATIVSALALLAARPTAAQSARADTGLRGWGRRVDSALALVDRAASEPDTSVRALPWLRAALDLAPGFVNGGDFGGDVHWFARVEVARRLALAASRAPSGAAIRAARVAVDSAKLTLWNCDLVCPPRFRQAIRTLGEAEARVDYLARRTRP
jgi:hypothetical protein